MLDSDSLKELLARADLPARDKLLACLAQEPIGPRKTTHVRDFAISLGLREAKKWNVSDYLGKSRPFAIRTREGWELTESGKQHVAALAGSSLPSVTTRVLSALRRQLPSISSASTRAFVEESISALETKLYRSAIVLSWVGAVSVLYEHVIANASSQFDAEASKRDPKWRQATNIDDLARWKEHEFLQILAAISVIGKSVKDELEVCLKLRNGCGHPNSLAVGEHRAAAHIETLIQNVFTRFS